MFRSLCILILAYVVLLAGTLAMSQEGGGFKKPKKVKGGDMGFPEGDGDSKKDKKAKSDDESAKMAKLLEKSNKKPETEREKVIKELSKLPPEQELSADFSEWYARVAGNRTEWRRDDITRKQIGEIFERVTERLDLNGDAITRDQFLRYARQYWRADDSPLWKEPKVVDLAQEAEKLFKHLDRDRNGLLNPDELPGPLRADMARWDKNGDGSISLDEYHVYFPRRLERLQREITEAPGHVPNLEIPAMDDRPHVIRAGKLPAGLPTWFKKLDADNDGQVALFEWRRSGWPLDEFANLDLNNDGFLEAHEVLKLLALTGRNGARPFAYLLEKRLERGPQ